MSALYIAVGRPRALPLDVLLRAIPSLPRAALARLVDKAIDRMDAEDGDADFEPSGDELDGTTSEDDWSLHSTWPDVAGCPVADPG